MTQLSSVQHVLINALEGGVERLEMAVRGLTFDQYDLSADKEAYPGTWTIREIIHHLVDDGDLWSMRIKQALAVSGTVVSMEGYPGNEAWGAYLDFENREVAPALALIAAHCDYLRELLTRFYNGWERYLIVIDRATGSKQEMTVLQIVEMLVEHLEEHLDQIQAIKDFNGI
jgi:DinB superfamily